MKKHSFIAGMAVLLLTSCSSVYLHNDFTSYSKTYSEASDETLLMSLARESHNEPVNFMQLGTISSQYQTTTSAGFNPTATRTSPIQIGAQGLAQHVLTFGGTLNAGIVQTPIFQFVPISGTNLTQALMNPISDKIFYTFYDQGYPADILARVMVEAVQIEMDPTNGSPSAQTNYDYYINDPNSKSFPQFLTFCNNLRQAQLYNTLIVAQKTVGNTLVYSNRSAHLSDVVSAISNGLSVTITSDGITTVTQSASKSGFATNTPSNLKSLFYTNENAEDKRLSQYNLFLSNNPPGSNIAFLTKAFLFSNSEKPERRPESAVAFAAKYETNHFTLKMRTFETALYTVAKQQEYFSRYDMNSEVPNVSSWLPHMYPSRDTNRHAGPHVETPAVDGTTVSNIDFAIRRAGISPSEKGDAEIFLENAWHAGLTNLEVALSLFPFQSSISLSLNEKGISYLHDANGPFAIVKNNDATNETFLVRPIMTLTYKDGKLPSDFQQNLEFSYRGQKYVVGDPKGDLARIGRYQDKTVFVLLSYLFSQTAINTQNLPVQQLIQVQ